MQIFLYKKNLIENCEKNYKQTCGKQKIANVSSVNECHKIDTSSRARKTEHISYEIEAKCARPVQDGVQTVKSHGIKNGNYFMYGTRIVGVLLRRTQIIFHRNLSNEPIAQIENFFSHRVPLVCVALRKSTLL